MSAHTYWTVLLVVVAVVLFATGVISGGATSGLLAFVTWTDR